MINYKWIGEIMENSNRRRKIVETIDYVNKRDRKVIRAESEAMERG